MPSSVKEVCVYSMLSDSRRASSRASAIMRREVHAGHSGAAAREEARVVAFAAPGVEHTPPAQIADEREERRVVEPSAGDVGTAAHLLGPRLGVAVPVASDLLDGEVVAHPAMWFLITRYSATSTAPAAAPIRVLWLTSMYFTPLGRTLSSRMRPTVVVMPSLLSRSRRGWGRNGSSWTLIHSAGAVGSPSSRASLRTPARACRTSAIDARRPSETKTDSVWPSRTFTRVHVTLISAGCSEKDLATFRLDLLLFLRDEGDEVVEDIEPHDARRAPGTGQTIHGGHDDRVEPEQVGQRLERDDQTGHGAVRDRDDEALPRSVAPGAARRPPPWPRRPRRGPRGRTYLRSRRGSRERPRPARPRPTSAGRRSSDRGAPGRIACQPSAPTRRGA